MKRYRRCVGLVVINKDGLVFVGKRIDSNLNAWQMPQGGIEKGESPRDAGLREMKEEIGTNNVKLIGEIDNWLNYDIPQKLSSKLWNGKYRGQKQKWFIMKFIGNNDEINIETAIPEFSEWKWIEVSKLQNVAIYFKTHIYKKVEENLNSLKLN